MTIRAPEAVAAEFLRKALADDALAVPKLETMARSAGLLGERQRISNAKPFRKAKSALGIESVRDGFGAGGSWLWKLPRDQEVSVALPRETSAGSSIKRRPVRAERNVPLDWVEGVDSLQYDRPVAGVPRHRWRQFVDDCTNFLSSQQAERAAQLGWDVWVLFGCCRDRPLVHRDGIGLLWAVNGGRVIEIHRDWAGIEFAPTGSQRIFDRRQVLAGDIAVPWIELDRRPREHR
jgi:hypothetical protein